MTCRLWFTVDTFPLSLGGTARTFNICQDLGLDDRYCFSPIPDLPFINFISEETCYVHEVIEATLKEAKTPKSFVNRKGLPPSSVVVASFFEQANLFPNISALGLSSETVGMGTGGLMLGKLQRKTIHELLENGEELDANHLVHGAPLKVAPDSTGYPHCNAVWNTPPNSKSPEYINTKYKIFNNDPINIKIYGNYNPSMRIPNYHETHVYVEHAEALSRIRTERDPLGGFDSPRYVQRKRNQPRTVPLFPKKRKKLKKNKGAKQIL